MAKTDWSKYEEVKTAPKTKWDQYEVVPDELLEASDDLIMPEGGISSGLAKSALRGGVKGVVDLPESIANIPSLAQKASRFLSKGAESLPFIGGGIKAANQLTNLPNMPQPHWGLGEKALNQLQRIPKVGQAFEKPIAEGPLDAIGNAAAEEAGSWLTGGALGKGAQLLGKANKYLGKALTPLSFGAPKNAKEAAELGIMGGLGGAASQGLQEAGVPEEYAQLAKLGSPFAYGAGKAGVKAILPKSNKSGLTQDQIIYARNLQSQLEQQGYNREQIGKIIEENLALERPEGYLPTTAEVAENPNLAKDYTLQQQELGFPQRFQSQENAIKKTKQELESGAENIGTTQAEIKRRKEKLESAATRRAERRKGNLEQVLTEHFPHGEKPKEQAGKALRETVGENVDYLKKERKDATAPMYDSINESKDKIDIKPVTELQKKYRVERGGRAGVSESTGKMLKSKLRENIGAALGQKVGLKGNKKTALKPVKIGPTKQAEEVVDYFKANLPESEAKNVSDVILGTGKNAPTLAEVANTRKTLNKMWSRAQARGDNAVAHSISEFKEAIDNSVKKSVSPEVFDNYQNVNKVYKEWSDQIAHIEKNRAMGPMLEREFYSSPHFRVGDAEIPMQFLKGEKAVENSKRLKPYLNSNPEAKKDMHSLINKLFIDEVIDPKTGVANVDKLAKFKEKYPGAENLYEHLDVKLNNVSNANKLYTDALKTNEAAVEKFTSSKAAELLNQNTDNTISKLFSKANKNPIDDAQDILKKIKQDNTGAALQGLRRDTAKYINQNFKGPVKFNELITKHKNILNEIFEPEQVKAFESINNALQGRKKASEVGKVKIGSDTATNLLNNLASQQNKQILLSKLLAKSLPFKIPFAQTIMKHVFKGLYNNEEKIYNQINKQIAMDPDFAKLMITTKLPEVQTLLKEIQKNSKYGPYMGWHKMTNDTSEDYDRE